MGSVDDCRSHIVDNMILLRDWYLIKSPKAHMGKRLAVGGIVSKQDQDVENFQSAPIIQRLNAFRLRTADGLIVLLLGRIDGQRTSGNGFPSEVVSLFQIGFPFTWEILANVYISSDDTSCSHLGRDNNVHEPMHCAGRARRVRVFSDDEKWCTKDSASGPENGRSMKSSFARKIEDKSGSPSFLKGPALDMGSNAKHFSPSDACKSKDKGIMDRENISSGSALGNIQELDDDDGKLHLHDGERGVKNCLDEAILNQTLLDTAKTVSTGISYKDRGIQPHNLCVHVNSDMEESEAYKPSQMKSTRNSYSVASVLVGQTVEMTPNSHEVGDVANTGFDKDCNSLHKSPECSNDMLSGNMPVEKLEGGDCNVGKDPEIQNVSSSEIICLSESGIVMPLAAPFKLSPASLVSSPVVLTHEKVPCQPVLSIPVDANSGAFVEYSVGERIRDTAELIIGGCTTSSNSKTVKEEHAKSENDSLLQSPVKRTKTSRLGLSKELSQRGTERKDSSSVPPFTHRLTRSRARLSSCEGLEKKEQSGSSGLKDRGNKDTTIPMDCPTDTSVDIDGSTSGAYEFGIEESKDKMRFDAESKDRVDKITRWKAMSSSLRSSQKEGKRGCSTWKDANEEDVAVSTYCSRDTVLNMVAGAETGKSKDKMSLDAKSFDSGHRSTRSRAMPSSLRSSQKEGECHTQKNTSNMDVTVSEGGSKEGVYDSKPGATESRVGEIINQESLNAKNLDGDELLNLSNTINHGTAKRKLQYGTATDLSTQHAGKHLLSAVGCDQIEGLVRQRSEVSDDLKELKHSCSETAAIGKKKKRKRLAQHAYPLFVPSSSAEKSSSAPRKALNLKMSSSGRLIVPPLAHWRNEQIVYDTEGGITCVFDGSQVVKRSGNILTRGRKLRL